MCFDDGSNIVDQARRSLANWFIVYLEVYIYIYVQNQNQFGWAIFRKISVMSDITWSEQKNIYI